MRVLNGTAALCFAMIMPRNMHEGRSKPTIASVMQQFGKTRCANYADFLRSIVRVCVNFQNSWLQCVQLNETHINGPSAQLRLRCLETLKRPRMMHHRPVGSSDLAGFKNVALIYIRVNSIVEIFFSDHDLNQCSSNLGS